MRGSDRTFAFTKLMPESRASAAMRSPRARSRVRTPEPSPNWEVLAMRIASASSAASMIAATDPVIAEAVRELIEVGYLTVPDPGTIEFTADGYDAIQRAHLDEQ